MIIPTNIFFLIISTIGTCGTGIITGAGSGLGKTAWNKISKENNINIEILETQKQNNKYINKLIYIYALQNQLLINEQSNSDCIKLKQLINYIANHDNDNFSDNETDSDDDN